MEIKEILRNKDNYYCAFTEPLLEYVEKVANYFWRDFAPEQYQEDEKGTVINDGLSESTIPNGFGIKYIAGVIDTTGKDNYISNEELQNTLIAFNLDASKFWYLCLCIKTYVKDQTVNAIKLKSSPREKINRLLAEMPNGELTFKAKGKKHKITITDNITLAIISTAITSLLKESNNLLDRVTIDVNDTTTLPLVYQIYLFNKYLSWFLKPLKAKKGIYASKDKSFLISKMIYIVGISDDARFITEYKDNGDKLDHLKNLLKRYKDIKIPTIPSLFW